MEPNQVPINYFSVESIEEHVDKVVKNRGKVIVPKQELPNVGLIVWIADPEGNSVGLIQPFEMKV